MANHKKQLNRSIALVCALFIVFLSIVLSVATLSRYTQSMYGQYEKEIANVITYVESHVDNDDLAKCAKTLKKTDTYNELQAFMDDFVDHYDVHYLYILKPLNTDPEYNIMCVCSGSTTYEKENEPDMVLDLGYTPKDYYSADLAQTFMNILHGDKEITFFTEETGWGSDYTGAKPLYTSDGRPYAILCVDFAVDDIWNAIYANTVVNIILTVVLGVLFVLLLLFWLHVNVTKPIKKLETSVVAYATSTHEKSSPEELVYHAPEIKTDNEIEALSEAVEKMSEDMRHFAEHVIEAEHRADEANAAAMRDALTGVRNKRAYEKYTGKLDWEIMDGDARFGIAMIDLNFLKKINDTYGHECGDAAIKSLCGMVCHIFSHSPVFRIGGDEFVVILQDRDYNDAELLIDGLQIRLNRLRMNPGLKEWERVSAAIGYAEYDKRADQKADDVFRRADHRMYENKKKMKAVRE